MNNIRFGIAGLGNMGSCHAHSLLDGKIPRASLAAVSDPAADLSRFSSQAKTFTSTEAMIRSGEIDAIIIATPHYFHTTLGMDALEQGLHVLVEKPVSVHKADAQRLIGAYQPEKHPGQIFGVMFNQRTDPHYIKLRELIQGGELGEIRRVTWLITNWFRTDAYYNSGGWRATWSGEGGGVLLNQSPHNLDLFQWLFGMPVRVRAHCKFGQYHDIEVEDDVTAYYEFANGGTASFITSTGEAPGTNRLEIAAERGRVVLEDGLIHWKRNETPSTEFRRTSASGYNAPPVWNIEIPIEGYGEQHNGILKNFVEAILDGTPLIAPAQGGIRSVELCNAMLMSTFLDKTIELPLDAALYETLLKEKIAASKGAEKLAKAIGGSSLSEDFGGSFNVHPSYAKL
jgi:predicted dehydrogenase